MKLNLENCPFCGSTYSPKPRREYQRTFCVRCSNCGATGPVATSYEAAAAKWNRRQTEREVAA